MDAVAIQIFSFQAVALAAIWGFLWKLHHEVVNLQRAMPTCASAWREWKVYWKASLVAYLNRNPDRVISGRFGVSHSACRLATESVATTN